MNSPAISSLFLITLLALSGCASSGKKALSKEQQIEGLMGMASAAITEDDPIAALNALNQVKEIDDSNPELYYYYSLAYLRKNETRLAIDSARTAIRLSPKFSAAKNTLGKILLDQGQYEESEKWLKESASDILFREASLPKLNLGILYYKKMNLAESERWLLASIQEKGPYSCLAHFYLGKLALEQQLLTKAEREFGFSTKGNCAPMKEAHIAFGQTLIRQKKYDMARAKFVEIQKLFPDSDTYDQAAQYLKDLP